MSRKEHIHYFSLPDIRIWYQALRKYLNPYFKMLFLHIEWCKFLNDGLFIRIGQIQISLRRLSSPIAEPLLRG